MHALRPPDLHPILQKLRTTSCSYLPRLGEFWNRVDLHRTWAHVEADFTRQSWARELRMYEIQEVGTLEKAVVEGRHELRLIKARTDTERAYYEEKLREVQGIERDLMEKQQQLAQYRATFEKTLALQQEVLRDKKELELVTSLIPLPYYLLLMMSTLTGLYWLLRQPVAQQLQELRCEIQTLRQQQQERKSDDADCNGASEPSEAHTAVPPLEVVVVPSIVRASEEPTPACEVGTLASRTSTGSSRFFDTLRRFCTHCAPSPTLTTNNVFVVAFFGNMCACFTRQIFRIIWYMLYTRLL